MLRIAVVANTFQQAKSFADAKFGDHILQYKTTTSTYHLKNGDTVYLCYSEETQQTYKTMEFDAFVVVPGYTSLLDVIRHRSERV